MIIIKKLLTMIFREVLKIRKCHNCEKEIQNEGSNASISNPDIVSRRGPEGYLAI